ncbi:MAG: 1,2-phenylacetyl-CoA epoxidase subunit PaaD [Acidimicrobiia bacterium]
MATTLTDAVRQAVREVTDPELPVATVADLGILEEVRVDESEGRVEVDLIPTFLGCPALEEIQEDVSAAARSVEGVKDVAVRFLSRPQWNPERITARGRERLAEGLTIAVSGPARQVICPVCGSRHVEERSPFGPTACRAIGYCSDCRNPVEVIRQ